MAAVEQTLPKAKREACIREARQVGVTRARENKKETAMEGVASNGSSIDAIPNHLLLKIFETLEPLDLARAACVSPAWACAAHTDSLWSKFVPDNQRTHNGSHRQNCLGLLPQDSDTLPKTRLSHHSLPCHPACPMQHPSSAGWPEGQHVCKLQQQA